MVGTNGVDLDGTTSYLSKTGAITGSANSQFLTSFWFKYNSGVGQREIYHCGPAGTGFTIAYNNNKIFIIMLGPGGGASASSQFASTTTFLAGSGWNHIILTGDTNYGVGNKIREIAVNGIVESPSSVNDPSAPFNIDWTKTVHSIGAGIGGVDRKWDGGLAEFYVTNTYLPLTQANIEKFYKNGLPVDLSTSGAPPGLIYLKGSASTFNVNSGTGGDFVTNGVFTVSATNPGNYYVATTEVPTFSPTPLPTALPTVFPTALPTMLPSQLPTALPTVNPTALPTALPTVIPTALPTPPPTVSPSALPSQSPTGLPTADPSQLPTGEPTALPTSPPTVIPSVLPSQSPSGTPTGLPTAEPSQSPSGTPTGLPTAVPSQSPSGTPTGLPTAVPSQSPSGTPTGLPTVEPSQSPSGTPTGLPTAVPSQSPSGTPTGLPTAVPSQSPSGTPTGLPTAVPSKSPSGLPTALPSQSPSRNPIALPTRFPSYSLTEWPSIAPSLRGPGLSDGNADNDDGIIPDSRGGGIALVVVVAILLFCLSYYWKHKNNKKKEAVTPENPEREDDIEEGRGRKKTNETIDTEESLSHSNKSSPKSSSPNDGRRVAGLENLDGNLLDSGEKQLTQESLKDLGYSPKKANWIQSVENVRRMSMLDDGYVLVVGKVRKSIVGRLFFNGVSPTEDHTLSTVRAIKDKDLSVVVEGDEEDQKSDVADRLSNGDIKSFQGRKDNLLPSTHASRPGSREASVLRQEGNESEEEGSVSDMVRRILEDSLPPSTHASRRESWEGSISHQESERSKSKDDDSQGAFIEIGRSLSWDLFSNNNDVIIENAPRIPESISSDNLSDSSGGKSEISSSSDDLSSLHSKISNSSARKMPLAEIIERHPSLSRISSRFSWSSGDISSESDVELENKPITRIVSGDNQGVVIPETIERNK